MNRLIALQFDKIESKDALMKQIDHLAANNLLDSAILFNFSGEHIECSNNIQSIDKSPDEFNIIPKRKNFIMEYAENEKKYDFLHIIESDIVFDADPKIFMDEVETTMDSLDYDIYFSTISDRCNYVFNKFNPRFSIEIDNDDIRTKLKLPSQISFTSHSNTEWTIYRIKEGQQIQRFDEKFSIAMFFIIEYLARRKSTKQPGQIYYMNQYLNVPSEKGAYHISKSTSKNIDEKLMQEEDAAFKAMKINYASDNNIDLILEETYALLMKKMAM